MEETEAKLLHADLAREPVPDAIEDELVLGYRARYGMKPEVNAAIHRLPPARFARFCENLRVALAELEAELPGSTSVEFAEFASDPKLEEDWIEGFLRNASWALDHRDFHGSYHSLTSYLRQVIGASEYGARILDRALSELQKLKAFHRTSVGGRLRLLIARVRFMALRGTARSIAPISPNEDLVWVDHISDAIGKEEPLAGLPPETVDELFASWRDVDWDGTLGLEEAFSRPVVRPAIEDVPWRKLAPLVECTSFTRLVRGERTVRALSRVFARPASLGDRLELGERIAAFGNAHGAEGVDAMKVVLGALIPELVAYDDPWPKALDAAAYKLCRQPDMRDALVSLPKKCVERWTQKLAKSKSDEDRKLAREYAAALLRKR